jgi:hypothetical protein
VSYVKAGINLGTTAPDDPVRKIFNTPPMENTPTGDSDLKSHGWTKLVKRSDGKTLFGSQGSVINAPLTQKNQ